MNENEDTFVTPVDYVSDEESLLSIAVWPFALFVAFLKHWLDRRHGSPTFF